MNQVIDNAVTTNDLPQLVEEYIAHKRNRTPSNSSYYRKSLQQLGYSSDQIQNLLIEMDDDADKELLAGDGSKKAKQKLILSLLVAFAGIALSIAGAIGAFGLVSLGLFIIPFGLIGTSFVVAGKAYAEIGLVEKRRKRRLMKYQNWK